MTSEPADGDGRSRWLTWGAALIVVVVALSTLSAAPARVAGSAELVGYVAGAVIGGVLVYRAILWVAGAVGGRWRSRG
jgi:hypothetical protein